jgi:hypothetical protein
VYILKVFIKSIAASSAHRAHHQNDPPFFHDLAHHNKQINDFYPFFHDRAHHNKQINDFYPADPD